MMIQTGGLLFLHAETALHPGAGTALGVIDLPVQRERHTGHPHIPASSLKGVLRDAARRKLRAGSETLSDANANPVLRVLFGKESNSGELHAGALGFGDARLLAFPVRSLKGVFAWVTCPAVLERFVRDAGFAGHRVNMPVLPVESLQCAAPPDSPLRVEGKQIVLEEYVFAAPPSPDAATVAEQLAGYLPATDVYAPTRERLRRSLAILSDDDFGHFVRHATEVVARIALDAETKTAAGKALFYQELLPPECLFYSAVLADDPRSKEPGQLRDASDVLARFAELLPAVVQIGGDETLGRGLCATRFLRSEDE